MELMMNRITDFRTYNTIIIFFGPISYFPHQFVYIKNKERERFCLFNQITDIFKM